MPDLPERRLDGISVSAIGKFLIDQVENNDRNNSREYRFHLDRPQTDVQLECPYEGNEIAASGRPPTNLLRRVDADLAAPQKNPGRGRGFSIRCEARGISTG
jgi:hypothetical protein